MTTLLRTVIGMKYHTDYPEELKDIVTTLEFEMSQNSNKILNAETAITLKNQTVFHQLLKELEFCLEKFNYTKKVSGNKKNTGCTSALLNEWLQRSKAIGRKVCSLYNTQGQPNSSRTIGLIAGLTKEGYLQIRTEDGDILTHVSGDIIDLNN